MGLHLGLKLEASGRAGEGEGGIAGGMTLPSPNSVNHFGISPSSWYKKAPVPLVYDGVVINYIQTLQKIFPGVTSIKLVSENYVTMNVTVSFDQKAISPGICKYQNIGFGVTPPINEADALHLMDNGYSQMFEELIKDFKTKNRKWIKEGKVFFVQLLDHFVAIPIAIYYLKAHCHA